MPVPNLIGDLSQTAASNYPSGGDSPATLDDTQRAHGSFIALLRDGKGHSAPVTLASATTTDIGGQNSLFVEIIGTTTITSLGSTYNGPRFLKFTGALLLTYNATSLVLPGAANITTTAGDTCIATPNAALNGWNLSSYTRASGVPSGVAASGANSDIISTGNNTSTVYTTAGTSTAYTITPTPAITAYAIGQSHFVNFNAACGTAPTITISGVATPPNLVKENADGTFSNLAAGDIPINHRSRVTLISTTQALVEKIPPSLTLGTASATTSGTALDFVAPAPGPKRATLTLYNFSTIGTDNYLAQLGSGSPTTSGYLGTGTRANGGAGSSVTSLNGTAGFLIHNLSGAANVISGSIVFTLLNASTNTWVGQGVLGNSDTTAASYVGGGIALAGALDRIRLTTTGAANTFDIGSANVLWEY